MNIEHPPAMQHKRYQDILPRPKALRAGRTPNIECRMKEKKQKSEANSSKSPLIRGVDAERTGCVKMGVVKME